MNEFIYNILRAIGFNHPLHPVITHLVIGPVLAAFIVAIIGLFVRKDALFVTARHMTVLALVFWFFTVGMGIMDWLQFYSGDTSMTPILIKSVLAGVLLILLVVAIFVHRKVPLRSWLPVPIYGAMVICVIVIGLQGGDIVYGGRQKQAASTVAVSAGAADTQGFKSAADGEFKVSWKIDGDKLRVKMAHNSTGWIAVGFGETGTMQGSEIYIGYVKDGKAFVSQDFGYGPDQHKPLSQLGSTPDITDVSGTSDGTSSEISFAVPLAASDPKHMSYTAGKSYEVIMAFGANGKFDVTSYHGPENYTSFTITL